MSYTSKTIASTLERINKDLFIPAIQRPSVWEPEQIIRFDSLRLRLNRLYELLKARRETLRAPQCGLWREHAHDIVTPSITDGQLLSVGSLATT